MKYDALVAHVEATRSPLPVAETIEYGGVHVDKFKIPAGMVLVSHCHVYDHPSILAVGKVELWTADGRVQELEGPAEVRIAAGVKHALQAITDVVWYCLHAGEPQIKGDA